MMLAQIHASVLRSGDNIASRPDHLLFRGCSQVFSVPSGEIRGSIFKFTAISSFSLETELPLQSIQGRYVTYAPSIHPRVPFHLKFLFFPDRIHRRVYEAIPFSL
jgi:hypothetical protein